jgi:hypothetical protein
MEPIILGSANTFLVSSSALKSWNYLFATVEDELDIIYVKKLVRKQLVRND